MAARAWSRRVLEPFQFHWKTTVDHENPHGFKLSVLDHGNHYQKFIFFKILILLQTFLKKYITVGG